MKSLTLLLLPLLLVLPVTSATQVSGDTYAIANSDQAVFTDAIVVNNTVYFLMSSAIYSFNLTSKEIHKIFDTGFNYILTSIIFTGTNFYVSGYKVYKSSVDSGGDGFTPVVTCPLPVQSYNIDNITVWQLNKNFAVQKSIVSDAIKLKNISYFYAIQASKLFNVNSTLYLAVFDATTDNTATFRILQVDFTNDSFTTKLQINKKIIDAAYGGKWILLDDSNTLYFYSESFQQEDTYTDSQYNLRIKSLYADKDYVYLAGRGYDGGAWGAALEIISYSKALIYYRQFDDYQFYSVYAADKYAIVAEDNTLYAIDYANNTITYEYSNTLTQVYDMKTEDFVDIHNDGPHSITIATWNSNGNLSFAWGGFYTDDNFLYAYMILTDKPSSIPFNPGDSGSGYIPYPLNDLWTRYKWYILLGGGLLLLIILSGGGRRE